MCHVLEVHLWNGIPLSAFCFRGVLCLWPPSLPLLLSLSIWPSNFQPDFNLRLFFKKHQDLPPFSGPACKWHKYLMGPEGHRSQRTNGIMCNVSVFVLAKCRCRCRCLPRTHTNTPTHTVLLIWLFSCFIITFLAFFSSTATAVRPPFASPEMQMTNEFYLLSLLATN